MELWIFRCFWGFLVLQCLCRVLLQVIVPELMREVLMVYLIYIRSVKGLLILPAELKIFSLGCCVKYSCRFIISLILVICNRIFGKMLFFSKHERARLG